MKLLLDAITFDLNGSVELDALESSSFSTLGRRTNKVATLDGGVAINDFGFTHADRDFQILVKPTPAQDSTLRYIVENYGQVYVSTREGFFKAIPEYSPGPEQSTLSLSVTEKLA